MSEVLAWVDGLPHALVYLLLAAGAALENVVPAVPADTFVALGGLLAGTGTFDARWVALGTWAANVAGALAVYHVSRRHGPDFFARGWGRYVMKPHQMERMRGFYDRWGLPAIFFSRFLPGVRVVVPVFAGATRQSALRVIPPIAVASAIWYGGLVWLGMWAGQNLDLLSGVLGRVNGTLAAVGAAVAALIAAWWWRTRHHPDE